MAVARIYYYKEIDPRINNDFKKLYLELHERERGKVIEMKKSFFKKNWVEIPFKEKIENVPAGREFIFQEYNIDSNPLATEKGQRILREKGLRHTSMSVGDMIKVSGEYWVVATIGWRRVRLL